MNDPEFLARMVYEEFIYFENSIFNLVTTLMTRPSFDGYIYRPNKNLDGSIEWVRETPLQSLKNILIYGLGSIPLGGRWKREVLTSSITIMARMMPKTTLQRSLVNAAQYLGTNGPIIPSKTIWHELGLKSKTAPGWRIDVENPRPGIDAGQVHVQYSGKGGGEKYIVLLEKGDGNVYTIKLFDYHTKTAVGSGVYKKLKNFGSKFVEKIAYGFEQLEDAAFNVSW